MLTGAGASERRHHLVDHPRTLFVAPERQTERERQVDHLEQRGVLTRITGSRRLQALRTMAAAA
jgi:hypothetical protein